jgi:hypothetical protein
VQPLVAIHDSELTRALEGIPAGADTPAGTGYQWWLNNWHYFVMPESVKEALRSDGTAFQVVHDSDIAAGGLLETNGQPRYPIVISLASEAIDDGEIAQFTNYVAAGGFLLVGSSSFTRNTNGTTRGDFAFANALGMHMVDPNLANWRANQYFLKLLNDRLVAEIPGGVLAWDMPTGADEIAQGITPNHSVLTGQLLWQVQASDATVIADGDTSPFLLTKQFGQGTFIYDAAMNPLLGHGGAAPGTSAYLIFRRAIEWAFSSAKVPITKVSPWRYPYDAAFMIRHELDNNQAYISNIVTSAQAEAASGAKGDYYFCTGTLRSQMGNSPAVISSLGQAVTNYGATIGSLNGGLGNPDNPNLQVTNYDYWHWGPDEVLDLTGTNIPSGYASGAAYAKASLSNSFADIGTWLSGISNGVAGWVSPYFNANREASYQVEEQVGVKTCGEQKLGPYPSWVLSTALNTAGKRYAFVSLPASDSFYQFHTAEYMDTPHSQGSMNDLIDFYYNLGGLVNLPSHDLSSGGLPPGVYADPAQYIAYCQDTNQHPRMWAANASSLYSWWLARSNAQVTATYSTNGNQSLITLGISGAGDPQTAVELYLPNASVSGLQVFTNGTLASGGAFRTNGQTLKLLVGMTVTNAQIVYTLNPQANPDYYSDFAGRVLSIPAPGVLANDATGAGTSLSAATAAGPWHGTLTLTNNGGFTYTPTNGFCGIDTFTYQVNDGVGNSSPTTVTLEVTSATNIFYDSFTRATNADPLTPWNIGLGKWTITNGTMEGTSSGFGDYADTFVAGNWSDVSVQARVQLPAGAWAAGLVGRVNPLSGANYTANIYPEGSPLAPTPALRLMKFTEWRSWSGNPMALVSLGAVGTNSHTLKMTFQGNEIKVFFDGTNVVDMFDNGFEGVPPYMSGGAGVHMYMEPAFVSTFKDFTIIPVRPAPVAATNLAFTTVQNTTLTVPPPGVLTNSLSGPGQYLAAALVSGPARGGLTLNTNGSFIYVPATNYEGTDTFTYEVVDGITNSAPATVTITVTPNPPPVANNDAYSTTIDNALNVPAPGVLANDTGGVGPLSAILVSGPAQGALTLNSNGGFIYTPTNGFYGTDTFTYQDFDGQSYSAPAVVSISVQGGGTFFYDDFTRGTDPGPLAPWQLEAGAWTVTGGMLNGGTNSLNSYGFVYLTNNWTDYQVQARLQFGPNAYGGGVGGRLNAATGARYAAWIYPSGNDLNLIKFSDWSSPSFLAMVPIPPLGTNWHTLDLAFEGSRIAAFLDGAQIASVVDNQSPLTSGGISLEMYTYTSAYTMSVANVAVSPLAVSAAYNTPENSPLIVTNPGVLANDADCYGTSMTATILSGPAHAASFSLNAAGGFSYMPATNYTGTDSFVYQASDGASIIGAATVTITVGSVRNGPSLPIQTNWVINELTQLTVTNTATDTDAPAPVLTYTLASSPTNAAINTNGVITWTPQQTQSPSTNTITTIVTDNGSPALSATNSFTVIVHEVNVAPVLGVIPTQHVNELTLLKVTNSASEPNQHSTTIGYGLVNPPAGMSINTSGVITWTPTQNQSPSTNTVTTVVTNSNPYDTLNPKLTATNSFTVIVQEVNQAPVLGVIPTQHVNELTLLKVTNSASEPNQHSTTIGYGLVNPPAGMSINASGVITWTPTQNQSPSTNTVTTVVTNSNPYDTLNPKLTATNNFTVIVQEVNQAPVLGVIPTQHVNELTLLKVTNSASEPNQHSTTIGYGLVNPPAGMSINTSGVITWTPTQNQSPSTNTVTTVVTNSNPYDTLNPQLTATNNFTVIVHEVNVAPVLGAIPTQHVNELTLLKVTNSASEPNQHSTTIGYGLVNPPAGMSINTSGVITWTPTQNQSPSTNTVTTVVTNSNPYDTLNPKLTATNSFTVIVQEVNQAPVLGIIPTQTVNELTLLSVTNSAGEPNQHSTTTGYALINPPTGMSIDSNGIITWTPSQNQSPSTNIVTTVVTNNNPYDTLNPRLTATNSFTVIVQEVNQAPVLGAIPTQIVNELTLLSVTNSAGEPNQHSTTTGYALVNAPAGMSIDSNGIITWTPSQNQSPSTNIVTTVVTNNNPYDTINPQLTATNSFTVIVQEVNQAPVLGAIPTQTVNELTLLSVTNSASEPNQHSTTIGYALINPPTGMSIDSNGIITWTPSQSQSPGTNIVTTVVTNNNPYDTLNQQLTATNSFTVIVQEVNVAPVLGVIPTQTVNELTLLSVTNSAGEPNQHSTTIGYGLVNAPAGMSINTSGVITWTPGDNQSPSTNIVTTVVTNSNPYDTLNPQLTASNSFTVIVQEVNEAPVLGLIPTQTVNELTLLSVTNSASEPNHYSITIGYALLNPPAGMSIDPNGVITWIPSQSQSPSTNTVTTVVTNSNPYDTLNPQLMATNSFTVTVGTASLAPRILSITTQNQAAVLTWTSVSGQTYWVQYNDSLSATNWQNALTNVTAVDTTTSATNLPGSAPYRFYRVVLVAP